MSPWLLAHDWAIQALAAGTLLLVIGLGWWWGRDRPAWRDLGTMSTSWRTSGDRHRNSTGK